MVVDLENLNTPVITNWAEASAGPTDRRNLRTETTEVEENGKQFKVTTSYTETTKQVPRVVAERKKWKKFGDSEKDGPGPNVSTTYAAEEIKLQFVHNQSDQELAENKKSSGSGGQGTGSGEYCRWCKSHGHWSHKCPHQDLYTAAEDKGLDSAQNMPSNAPPAYVIPSQRDRGMGNLSERRNEEYTCRVTNLPEDIPDLEERLRYMFDQCGRIDRFYLARDKTTNRLRGFAFITYANRKDAENAIATFNNAKFEHMILKVEWTKPSNN